MELDIPDYNKIAKERAAKVKRFKKKLASVRVGLPKKVVFTYNEGTVICIPKERKWVVTPKGKKTYTRIIEQEDRNDVTKYKAKHLLKLAILGVLKDDQPQNKKNARR